MVNYIPERADIVWLNFRPQKGKEITKIRPAVIVSPKNYNERVGLALCLPITSKIKNYPFEVPINITEIKGAILCDQMKSLDWRERKASFITRLSLSNFAKVLAKFSLLIK